jgi:hypothetical protein
VGALVAPREGSAGQAAPAEPDHFSLRLATDDGTITCRPDGSHPIERPAARAEPADPDAPPLPPLTHSPDGQHALFARDGAIYVADANGRNAVRISPEGVAEAGGPTWSPDGPLVAFAARDGEHEQVHVVDRDSGNARQLTTAADAPHGAWHPRLGPDGRIAYLVYHPRRGKLQPADLLVTTVAALDPRADGIHPKPAVVARGVYVSTFAWSPDGRSIAYATLGALVFHDLATGREQVIDFKADVDRRLDSHTAFALAWRPDGRAVACTIQFLGGRQLGGPPIFGDGEVFVLPRDGRPSGFTAARPVRAIEWIAPRLD